MACVVILHVWNCSSVGKIVRRSHLCFMEWNVQLMFINLPDNSRVGTVKGLPKQLQRNASNPLPRFICEENVRLGMDRSWFFRPFGWWAGSPTCHFPISCVRFPSERFPTLLFIFESFSFLDLMASSPASFFAPPWDIDLARRTDQLMSVRYKSDCTSYVGCFMDRWVYLSFDMMMMIFKHRSFSDDKVEGLQLSSAFDTTCRAWKVNKDILN
jgi:hypothetical protein